MTQHPTRSEKRTALLEGRRRFKLALKAGQEAEHGLKRVVNDLSVFARLRIAIRIILGAWE